MTTAPTRDAKPRSRRDATINLRLTSVARDLIDAAASATGKTRTEFVIESARRHAAEALLDQRLFELSGPQWEALNAALDSPPLPNTALRKLMKAKPPWEG